MKIAINTSKGAFNLSHTALMEYSKRKGFELYPFIAEATIDGRVCVPYSGQKYSWVYYSLSPIEKNDKFFPKVFDISTIKRNDKDLIDIISELGERQSSCGDSTIKVIDVPDNLDFVVESCNGEEWVSEKHKIWR